MIKKLLGPIAVVVTLFTFAPTKAEAGHPFRHSSFHAYRGFVHRPPVRHYSNRYVRPVYNNQCQPRYTNGYRYYPGYRSAPNYNRGYYNTGYSNRGYYNPGYSNRGYYNPGYSNRGYYNPGYSNRGNSGVGVSVHTRFGSFYIR